MGGAFGIRRADAGDSGTALRSTVHPVGTGLASQLPWRNRDLEAWKHAAARLWGLRVTPAHPAWWARWPRPTGRQLSWVEVPHLAAGHPPGHAADPMLAPHAGPV